MGPTFVLVPYFIEHKEIELPPNLSFVWHIFTLLRNREEGGNWNRAGESWSFESGLMKSVR